MQVNTEWILSVRLVECFWQHIRYVEEANSEQVPNHRYELQKISKPISTRANLKVLFYSWRRTIAVVLSLKHFINCTMTTSNGDHDWTNHTECPLVVHSFFKCLKSIQVGNDFDKQLVIGKHKFWTDYSEGRFGGVSSSLFRHCWRGNMLLSRVVKSAGKSREK